MTRLSLTTLTEVTGARSPLFDPAQLRAGIVHLGVGAFHRAHQAVFTDDAIEAAGGDWGVVGLSLVRPEAALALNPQNGLYTVEFRRAEPNYRIIGSLRGVITAPERPEAALAALADSAIKLVTLTVTEPAYRLRPDGTLDLDHADIRSDLVAGAGPRSPVGWLVAGLERRRHLGGGPISILSCDNLRQNGRKLRAAILTMAARRDPDLAAWIAGEVAFPNTMVDAITPASDAELLARVHTRIGLRDRAAVQREPFAQWVIEDRFAAGRPGWERAGAELVSDVTAHEARKLHVLNAAHSALAYIGLPRGLRLVREAMADPDIAGFLDAMIEMEIAPFLGDAAVAPYWRATRARLREPAVDHRLDQIARDGASKLRERIHPAIIANVRAGRSAARLARVVNAWLEFEGRAPEGALADSTLFSEPFRVDDALRAVVLGPQS